MSSDVEAAQVGSVAADSDEGGGGSFNTIFTFAGTGEEGFSGDGGLAVDARLGRTFAVAVGGDGTVFVADPFNGRVRAVGPDGIISTVAGTGTGGFAGDGGPATQAGCFPEGLAVAPDGTVFISGDNRVRAVGPDGIISTVAGTGTRGFAGDGGPALHAELDAPQGLAVGSDGTLYIADKRNCRIRAVRPDGMISTVAGNGNDGFDGDGKPATHASLSYPWGVTVGSDGSLYIADTINSRIRVVRPDGTISTVAGTGTRGFAGDGGPAAEAQLSSPSDVAVTADGTLYIADTNSNRVRAVAPDGTISTFAGGNWGNDEDGEPATAAELMQPASVAATPAGDTVYIADTFNQRVRKVVRTPLPAPVILAPEDGSPTRDARPLFAGTGITGATVTVTTGTGPGAVLGTATVIGGGWALRPAHGLTAAPHTVTAAQTAPGRLPSPPSSPTTFTITD